MQNEILMIFSSANLWMGETKTKRNPREEWDLITFSSAILLMGLINIIDYEFLQHMTDQMANEKWEENCTERITLCYWSLTCFYAPILISIHCIIVSALGLI